MVDKITLPPTSYDPAPIAARDGELAGDIRDGIRFMHALDEDLRRSVFDVAVTVLALLEELGERGAIDPATLAARVPAKEELQRADAASHLEVLIHEDIDKYTLECPPIPCPELIPLCRGRCCTLHFALSRQDLDERVIKFNYLQPYVIRQRDTDRYCVHNDPATKGCTAYHHRPAVCRTYDCRNDKRIWQDYENRIPAIDPALEAKEVPVPQGVLLD